MALKPKLAENPGLRRKMDQLEKGKRSIIVVEDDKEILDSSKTILESEGYEVETACNGTQCIEKCRARLFDLALLDIKLPEMEGTEVLAVLHREFPGMVKIMMTGYPSLENAIASLKSGADAYIMKPVNPKRLLDVVAKMLRERDSEIERTLRM